MVSELRQGTLVRTRIVFVTDRTYLFLLFSTPFVLSLFFILIFILNFLPVILRILVYFYFCLLLFFPIPSDYSPSVYFFYPSPFIFVFTSEFIPFFLSTTCTCLHLTSTFFLRFYIFLLCVVLFHFLLFFSFLVTSFFIPFCSTSFFVFTSFSLCIVVLELNALFGHESSHLLSSTSI